MQFDYDPWEGLILKMFGGFVVVFDAVVCLTIAIGMPSIILL